MKLGVTSFLKRRMCSILNSNTGRLYMGKGRIDDYSSGCAIIAEA